MTIFLTSLGGFSLGKLLGKNCGLDCEFSDFGFIEYLILILVFIFAFLVGKKLVKYVRNK